VDSNTTDFQPRARALAVAAGSRLEQLTSTAVRRIAGLVLMLLPLTAASASASTSVPPCPQLFGSFTGQAPPPGCWRPYGPGSPFNKPIPSGARVAPDSGAIVGQMLSDEVGFAGGKQSFQLQSQGSRPVYWSQPSDPLVTIRCTYLWGPNTCQGANGEVIDGLRIQIPAGAEPEQQSDGHLTVIDQADNSEYDFERASWSGPNELTVASGSEIPISGDGGTGLGGNADAGDFGLLAGIIRPSELKAGAINHALAISVPCTQGYVWPSHGPWGLACSDIGRSAYGALHMGSLLQLRMSDRQIAATGARAWQQAIMRAMARYGLYVNDTNGGTDNQTLELESESDESFTSLGDAPQMQDLLRSFGGQTWSNGAIGVDGVPINVDRLRVVAPCVQHGRCLPKRGRRRRRH